MSSTNFLVKPTVVQRAGSSFKLDSDTITDKV